MGNSNPKVRNSYKSRSQSSAEFSIAYDILHFWRAWNTWNNFVRFDLRQLEAESDVPRNFRTELRILAHFVMHLELWNRSASTVYQSLPARPALGFSDRGLFREQPGGIPHFPQADFKTDWHGRGQV
jgi:hypothetical protein